MIAIACDTFMQPFLNPIRTPFRSTFALLLFLALLLFASTLATAQTTRPIADVDHVVIISIDGGRPDLLLRGNCPSIRALMARGSYSFWARTTAMSITLPSHVSMLTGVVPDRHGILWNEDLPLQKPIYPRYPTIFEQAHRAGYTTGMVASKQKFDTLNKPGTVDFVQIHDKANDDDYTGTLACAMVTEHRPQVLFVHFGGTDVAGHAIGWGTDTYMKELEKVDTNIGKIVAAIDGQGLLGHTAILVTADHGGAGRAHGPDDPRSRHIPWIIAGPGIRQDFDLTRIDSLEINTEDTFATSCFLLGIPLKPGIDGKPIKQILSDADLLSH
jgi:arylsulfatase A-like enzyme